MSKGKNNMNKKIFILSVLLVSVITLTYFCDTPTFAKNIFSQKLIKIYDKTGPTASEALSYVDTYQEQYFSIIKRNDVLLRYDDDKNLKKDRKELNNLYKTVKKQITNKDYLKKYNEIEKRYSKCDEITTTGMNEFLDRYYNEVDSLLNEVYREVKTKISAEDLKYLNLSETTWQKEVENYKKVFDSMEYGTIGTSIYYTYQIDMKQFRTLLLMLYL